MTESRPPVLEALRRYALSYQASVHALARWMELPVNDGTALGEVIWAEGEGAPLTPARLTARLGFTSGATNALVNRLEALGLVERSRESVDRRVVTLRATAAAHERAEPFLARGRAELDAALAGWDSATLATVAEVLDRFASVLPGDEPRAR
jgi:DNA-binding MarR family transcriptional regulator